MKQYASTQRRDKPTDDSESTDATAAVGVGNPFFRSRATPQNRTEQDYIPGTGHRSQRGTWPNGEAYIVSVHKLRA